MGGLEDKCHWLLSPDEQMRAKWARLGDVGGGGAVDRGSAAQPQAEQGGHGCRL